MELKSTAGLALARMGYLQTSRALWVLPLAVNFPPFCQTVFDFLESKSTTAGVKWITTHG
jgi:hypothetical protein